MFLDTLTRVSNAQVTGAAAVSSSYDLGSARQVGTGSPLVAGLTVGVAPTGVSLQVEVISATDAALTASVLAHASRTILAADAPVGAQFAFEIPQGTPTQRYLGLRYTVPSGTSTVTAWIAPRDMVSLPPVAYPKGYTA